VLGKSPNRYQRTPKAKGRRMKLGMSRVSDKGTDIERKFDDLPS
jgi:hypothetical protein